MGIAGAVSYAFFERKLGIRKTGLLGFTNIYLRFPLPSAISWVTFEFLREKMISTMKSSIHFYSSTTFQKRCPPLDSSTSTGINGNPKVPSLVNSQLAGELPSQSSNWSAEY
uniref:Uncharacterized protein n=1 Tax=Heterorhabditis bacteriophora TaxID=37862 RepID=A0A1I7WJ22_HETBA